MATVWEFVEGVGAMVGLATGGFVLWDYFTRQSPFAFLTVMPFVKGATSGQKYLVLRIINRSERPILVTWKGSFKDNEMRLSVNNSIAAGVNLSMNYENIINIIGNEIRDFTVYEPANFNEIGDEGILKARIRWYYAQPIFYKKPRSFTVKISKKNFKSLIAGDLERFG